MPSAIGLIRVESNSDMVRREQEAQRATEEARERQVTPAMTGLAAHVHECWTQARNAKSNVERRLRRAQQALHGEYDQEKKSAIQQFGGSQEYARVTANKIRIVTAWLRDVFLGQKDKPWTVSPTPKPDFPPDVEAQVRQMVSARVAEAFAVNGVPPDPALVRAYQSQLMDQFEEQLMEEARNVTQRMEKRMADQMAEANFQAVFGDFLANLATYPTAILKGPILRKKKRLTWQGQGGTAAPTPQVTTKIVPEWENVDPFMFYPAPGISDPQDGYVLEHLKFTRAELFDLIGLPGYDEEAIRAIIREGDWGGLNNWLGFQTDQGESIDDIPEGLERKVYEFDCLEFHGPVRGKDLMDWGLRDEAINDPEQMYEACIWMIGSWVIKAQINYDPLDQRPYTATSYETLPGEFWGMGLADILDDVQGVANAAVRSLVNNMGMASGPQVAVNVDKLAPGEDVSQIIPWKIWQMGESAFGDQSKGIEFFQPDSNVQPLLEVLETFYRLADDFSLVPRYMAGADNVGGAGRTASGLSMLMDAANKGLKGVVANVDTDVLHGTLTKLYNFNMLYDPDPTIKGDAQVQARGAVSLMRLESLQLRRNEFLAATGQNEYDMQIIGPEGRAEVLRSVADGLELNTDKIVPPEARRQMAPSAPAGGSPRAPNQEVLQDGSAVTDNFSPNALTP